MPLPTDCSLLCLTSSPSLHIPTHSTFIGTLGILGIFFHLLFVDPRKPWFGLGSEVGTEGVWDTGFKVISETVVLTLAYTIVIT